MTMSVAKHLSKFTRSSSNAGDNASFSEEDMMYKRTHGLSSDPLAQLAIVMSGLIHGTLTARNGYHVFSILMRTFYSAVE